MGRTCGIYVFVVVPCLPGSTLWKSDIWQGSVTEGITVCAFILYADLAIIFCAASTFGRASGRIPSTKISKTFIIFRPFFIYKI
jgi:hypothetical protein